MGLLHYDKDVFLFSHLHVHWRLSGLICAPLTYLLLDLDYPIEVIGLNFDQRRLKLILKGACLMHFEYAWVLKHAHDRVLLLGLLAKLASLVHLHDHVAPQHLRVETEYLRLATEGHELHSLRSVVLSYRWQSLKRVLELLAKGFALVVH